MKYSWGLYYFFFRVLSTWRNPTLKVVWGERHGQGRTWQMHVCVPSIKLFFVNTHYSSELGIQNWPISVLLTSYCRNAIFIRWFFSYCNKENCTDSGPFPSIQVLFISLRSFSFFPVMSRLCWEHLSTVKLKNEMYMSVIWGAVANSVAALNSCFYI